MTIKSIEVKDISKLYHLGRVRHNSLRDTLMSLIRDPRRDARNDFWALKDVSFNASPGETLGLIGRNGAGKSTILKILSRITRPTTGIVEIRGRVVSLLEVGTGFHSELTGRENIFLNAAILGMKRAEILAKFDEIADFSELGKFIDVPSKQYSSGMYMRLGFAVAAHLEPDVMIVDEVLAVGDSAFQKKCISKMHDVGHSGKTVVFVSHDMKSVRKLCTRTVWLSDGKVVMDGATDKVVDAYEKEMALPRVIEETAE
ncbi:MAG: ABC transporter ATP-binding protein [Chloracidobacterium sp.]|nr:ABC transporter ATP-binding protein [Chloracidobacterium sp.]